MHYTTHCSLGALGLASPSDVVGELEIGPLIGGASGSLLETVSGSRGSLLGPVAVLGLAMSMYVCAVSR